MTARSFQAALGSIGTTVEIQAENRSRLLLLPQLCVLTLRKRTLALTVIELPVGAIVIVSLDPQARSLAGVTACELTSILNATP